MTQNSFPKGELGEPDFSLAHSLIASISFSSSLADRYCNRYSCDRFNRSFLWRFLFRIGFISLVIGWTGLYLFRFKMTKAPGSSRSPKEEGGRSTRPLRNEQIMFSYSFLSKPEDFLIGAERRECSRRLKDYIKSFIPSSQSIYRLCRDCNYCFRVLSPASRPCVGGVKLGDFSFVGNNITQLAFRFYISNLGVPVF